MFTVHDLKKKALYISYDGALEPLGRSQVIPYLKGLTRKGISFSLMTYEKQADIVKREEVRHLKDDLQRHGIQWIPLKYHKWPTVPATSFDILQGIIVGAYFLTKNRIEVVHARSYISAMIAFVFKKVFHTQLIFDMRGFWADEKVEAGRWNRGILYRTVKYFEKLYLLNADQVVVLSEEAKREIEKFEYLQNRKMDIEVIPTCVDLKKFIPVEGQGPEKSQNITFIYSGSYGPYSWYMLDEMLDFFTVVKETSPDAHFIFLTYLPHLPLRETLSRKGLSEAHFTINDVPYDDMPLWIPRAHAAIFFIKPTYSKKGTCATKMGEYLATGIPVIINEGIGDSDKIVEEERVGVVIKEFSREEYQERLRQLKGLLMEKDIKERCRNTAKKYFSLENAIEKYYKLYKLS